MTRFLELPEHYQVITDKPRIDPVIIPQLEGETFLALNPKQRLTYFNRSIYAWQN